MKKKTNKQRHPMEIRSGKHKGKLPHEVGEDQLLAFLITEGMTRADYDTNVDKGDKFLANMEEFGAPVMTRELTPDQCGWAIHDHHAHYITPRAKWFLKDPDRARGAVIPAAVQFRRTRKYAEQCKCDKPDYSYWGKRYDGEELNQCENCGEVVA